MIPHHNEAVPAPLDPELVDARTPDEQAFYLDELGELFDLVASKRNSECPDGMMLVDSIPEIPVQHLVALFENARHEEGFDAWSFWKQHFHVPDYSKLGNSMGPNGVDLNTYLSQSWHDLTYHVPKDTGTLIGTEFPHIRAGKGNRYAVGYYWDLAGLRGLAVEAMQDQEKRQLLYGVAANLRNTVRRFGYIPNGLRTYYTGRPARNGEPGIDGRSQPPTFLDVIRMVSKVEASWGNETNIEEEFLPEIVQEYEWWMRGEQYLRHAPAGSAAEHVVKLDGGAYMARHYSGNRTPRPESFMEDIETASKERDRLPEEVFQNLGSGAEQGTDFCPTIQCKDPTRLETMQVLDIIPVELNSLLADYERFIADCHLRAGRSNLEAEFRDRFSRRTDFLHAHNYDPRTGMFHDYNWKTRERVPHLSMSTAVPLRLGFTTMEETVGVSRNLTDMSGDSFLQVGGFVTTLLKLEYPQQWERGFEQGNGWPRQQYDGVAALETVGPRLQELREQRGIDIKGSPLYHQHQQLALAGLRAARYARQRWISHNKAIYEQHGTLMEKVDVVGKHPRIGHNGEYPTQQDFMWTIGMMQRMMHDLASQQVANRDRQSASLLV